MPTLAGRFRRPCWTKLRFWILLQRWLVRRAARSLGVTRWEESSLPASSSDFLTALTLLCPCAECFRGGVGTWNQALDSEFAFKTLLASGTSLQLVNITDPNTNLALAEGLLASAQATPQGKARFALSAALGDIPGWFNPASPEPARKDFASREANQFLWASEVDFPFVFALRAELEFRAGGNPSWNTGVDYRTQLNRSVDREEVRALYQQAGLSLDADLDALKDAARITANPDSVDYLAQNIIFNGRINFPVLTLHTTGDGLVSNQNESAYKDVVDEAGNQRLLRRTFVHRAGHCTFTPAETVTALQNLIERLKTEGGLILIRARLTLKPRHWEH